MSNELSKEKEDEFEEEDTLKDKYLTFHLGSEDYGIAIRNVIEIIGIQKITEVPDTPNYVKGVINLRGKVIPIMDMRLRFHMPEKAYNERTCVIVIQVEDIVVGLVVDTVSEVVSIPEKDVEETFNHRLDKSCTFIQGMGKIEDQIKILLDVEKLLANNDVNFLPDSSATRQEA